MKKKLLFVIDSLTIGGAEKSLVSLLNLLDYTKYEIDLLMFKQGGDFEKFLPSQVQVIQPPEYYQYLSGRKINYSKALKFLIYRSKISLNLRLNKIKRKKLHGEQVVYVNIKRILSPIEKEYDVGIAYSQGMPTYFVANKVKAKKKLAWINTDYVNTLYDKEVDSNSYNKINKIVAVSEHIKKSVSHIREDYANKVEVVLDIIDPKLINAMANEIEVDEFSDCVTNILTVGRLDRVKGYDKALEVAKLLKSEGYHFKWFSIGEGPERKKLQESIESFKLNDCFILLGKKINPYKYMKNCDLYVQTSRSEGFGLTICEAKILKKPIVCTGFPTAKEIINSNIDGLIVDHDINSILKGVKKFLDDYDFKNRITKELNILESYSSTNQIDKFYNLIEG